MPRAQLLQLLRLTSVPFSRRVPSVMAIPPSLCKRGPVPVVYRAMRLVRAEFEKRRHGHADRNDADGAVADAARFPRREAGGCAHA